jgi:hypothetical protein
MHPITVSELEVLLRLTSVDFEGVEELRAQIASISEVVPNCSCGCPSFTPIIDRSQVPRARLDSMLPTELVERERADGVPRTVIWFADVDGFISNVECVYYDDALGEWPDPQSCDVLVRAV